MNLFFMHRNTLEDFISLLVNILRYDFVNGDDQRFSQVEEVSNQ